MFYLVKSSWYVKTQASSHVYYCQPILCCGLVSILEKAIPLSVCTQLAGVSVVAQFYPWFNFYFPLFYTHYHTLSYIIIHYRTLSYIIIHKNKGK